MRGERRNPGSPGQLGGDALDVGADEERHRDRERGDLLRHHRQRRLALVLAGTPPERAVPHMDVVRVHRMKRDQNLGEQSAGHEHREREHRALADGEPRTAGGVDDLHPREDAGEREADVLEDVQRRVRDRRVVRDGNVPDAEAEQPERERDPRPQEKRCERAQRAVRDRSQHGRREQEETERAARAEHDQGGPEIAEHQVLDHVRRQQLVLSDRVHRGDECERRDGDAGDEQQRAPDVGMRRAGAAPQPHERLRVQREREDREHDRRRVQGPDVLHSVDDARCGRGCQASRSRRNVTGTSRASSTSLVRHHWQTRADHADLHVDQIHGEDEAGERAGGAGCPCEVGRGSRRVAPIRT